MERMYHKFWQQNIMIFSRQSIGTLRTNSTCGLDYVYLDASHRELLYTYRLRIFVFIIRYCIDDCDDVCQAEIQKSRKILIHDVCYKTDTTAPDISNQSFINHLNHLYVIDKYKLLYCFVPKVACTNIKRTLLTGLDFLQPNQEIPHIDIHVMADSVLPLLSNFKPKDIMYRLNEYQKVLFVREPISRLVSAYRDKLEKPTNQDSINFRKKFSAKIKKLKDSVDDLTNGIEYNATFEDFASYLGDPSTVLDYTEDHWRPISDLCMPCQIKYDFIGKFETLTRDNDFVIKKFLLPNSADLHLHPPTNPTNSSHRSTIDKYTSNLRNRR
ncbi:putative carbohydrate sulfotransferase 13 [Apostichopus japonicus]|uniref:Carbohydrate sulfotransferase n=1 Tax=Stichopus japonicus TaxID=307972 RepID=A0A2G8KPC9_STIJA|nr:putative carbohydrate sulfotransferase 13 [Apostichopus japonicus]